MSKVQQKQLKRRTEIIETAIRLMNDTPFDALSVSDICEAADISIGSFYHYFSRKSDLLVGLLSLVDEALEETVFPSLTHPDQREDLRLLARGFASYIQGNDLERSRLIAAIEPFDTDLSGRPRALVVKVAELFRRGQEVEQITRSLPAEELTPINQVEMIPDTADQAALTLYRAGILTGVDASGAFAGNRGLTRAELAVVLARIVDPSRRVLLPAS